MNLGKYDFTLNQYLMRGEFLPFVSYSQPAKPGLITVVTKNEKKAHDIHSLLIMERVFSTEAILLVCAIGLLGFLSVMFISKIQGTKVDMYMAWDVVYG